MRLTSIFLTTCLSLLIGSSPAQASRYPVMGAEPLPGSGQAVPKEALLPPEIATLVLDETQHNPGSIARSLTPVRLQYFLIPMDHSAVMRDIADRCPQDVRDSLVVVKGGKEHLRWIINPEDTKFHLGVQEFLKKAGLDSTLHGLEPGPAALYGYQTSSRSYIVKNGANGAIFSIKASTNETAGRWKNKGVTWDYVKRIRAIADFIQARYRKISPDIARSLVVEDEIAGFGLNAGGFSEGLLVRALPFEPGKFWIPGFAIFHGERGKALAALNGSGDPARFWAENYMDLLGKNMARLEALTGGDFQSAHSQQFKVQVDRAGRPTGLLAVRDIGDVSLSSQFFEALGRSDILRLWPSEYPGRLKLTIGPGFAMDRPAWLSEEGLQAWGQRYFHAFDAEMEKITGESRHSLGLEGPIQYTEKRYFHRNTKTVGSSWDRYFRSLARKEGHTAAELKEIDERLRLISYVAVLDTAAPPQDFAARAPELLRQGRPAIRRKAVQALANLPVWSDQIWAELPRLFSDDTGDVVESAVKALSSRSPWTPDIARRMQEILLTQAVEGKLFREVRNRLAREKQPPALSAKLLSLMASANPEDHRRAARILWGMPEWGADIWEKVPEFARKLLPRSRTEIALLAKEPESALSWLTFAASHQKSWPDSFMALTPGFLMSGIPEVETVTIQALEHRPNCTPRILDMLKQKLALAQTHELRESIQNTLKGQARISHAPCPRLFRRVGLGAGSAAGGGCDPCEDSRKSISR